MHQQKGLSLIELLIVIAVVGILASIAYPSYSDQVRKAARTEVVGVLFTSAQQLQRHYSRAGQYSDSEAVVTPLVSGTDHYSLHAVRDKESFTLLARRLPGGLMTADRCGDYVLDQAGVRGNRQSAEDASKGCWGG
ncbi:MULTISPECIES: type IV pilin protein [Pseudomonas]|uniref:Type IV pilin protein n=1 Tax=Pseudomonas sp. Hg7Tf TaxID=3236988 RepID=A0AB39I2K5_9PSED|nr:MULTISPECIES: type IV pilin protein [Pseudomonas]KJJ99584.1 type IV pili biogenesis protein PilE [Pseudomonas sp. 5]MDD1978535.1 prepilin-type N-terminal cleavage/methylation domain-containing protein [Pseudomonas putida]MDH2561288.1 type IV pilin protein [Pseudomonas sp. Hg5Tf]